MANFCVVAGIDLDIKADQCSMRHLEIGTRTRMFDGTLRAAIRAVKRELSVAVAMLTPAADAALRAACGNGATTVTWTGDVLGGAVVNANVEFTDMAYGQQWLTHTREPQLVIREI